MCYTYTFFMDCHTHKEELTSVSEDVKIGMNNSRSKINLQTHTHGHRYPLGNIFPFSIVDI